MRANVKEQIQVMSVSSDATVRQVMQTVDQGAMGTALLIEDGTGRLKGVVTDGDLRRALLKGAGLESPISEVDRPASRTLRVGASAEEVTALAEAGMRFVPVLDENDRVVDLTWFDGRIHLPISEPFLGESEFRYVSECMLTGWISSAGKYVTRFEEMFAEFCGTKHCVATSNGTTALHLALLALDIEPGDEVIVPTLSFIASANSVKYCGATPVFVDSEESTWNIDPNVIEAAITSKTKAIMPVHLYGHPADMDPIHEIAQKHGLRVIEDAAEAHGARYKDRVVGGLSDVATFSFYGNKTFTTGEGGTITTNDGEMADRMRKLRDHGMSRTQRYVHDVLGYNYRLTNVQAAIGVGQLERAEQILAYKRRIAMTYERHLCGIPGVTLPPEAPWAQNVYWLYSILIDESTFGMSRDTLMEKLKESGIDTRPLFPCMHRQPIYDTKQDLPVAQHLSAIGMNLPSMVGLQENEILRICDTIRRNAKGA